MEELDTLEFTGSDVDIWLQSIEMFANNICNQASNELSKTQLNVLKKIANAQRGTGRTTRLVDEYIQYLYDNLDQPVVVIDHHDGFGGSRYLTERIVNRIKNEHPHDFRRIVVNNKNSSIEIMMLSNQSLLAEKIKKQNNSVADGENIQ